jgi:hypothetical protein
MVDFRSEAIDRLAPVGTERMLVRRGLPRSPARWERIAERTATAAISPHNLPGIGLAVALAMTLWAFGATWLAPWLVAAGAVHYAGAVTLGSVRAARLERARGPLALPLAPEVDPAEVASTTLRATYEDILRLHEDIRCALLAAERMQASLRTVFDRCSEVVRVAGRLARLANPLQHYLELHPTTHVERELDRLAGTADGAADPLAQGVYQTAVAARGRQLGTLIEIQNLRDRIAARLELISASLESVSALVIKLQVLDLEQVDLVGETISEHLSTLGDELAVLETTIEDGV